VVHDADGLIQFANPAARVLLDVDEASLLGGSSLDRHWDVIHEDGSPFPGDTHPVMVALTERRAVRNVVLGVRRPSRDDRVWLLVDAVPQFDSQGLMLRVVVCFNDISDQQRAEADLRVERDLLTGVMNSSVAAITVLNPGGEILFANASAERILGLTPRELSQCRYDDPQWQHTALDGGPWPDEAQPFNRIMATGKPVHDIRHAIQWPDGSRRYLSINGEAVRDARGRIIYLVFLITDITDRHLAEQALAESEGRFRLLAENMSDLVCLHGLDGRPSYISPSARTLLGYTPEELLRHDLGALLHPADREPVRRHGFTRCLRGETAAATYRIRHKDGEFLWLETLFRPIHDACGAVCQVQSTSRDVSEKVRIQQQLAHDALHDGLTGLPNRNLLLNRLEFALKRAARHLDYRFAVLFMDLDRFKLINDSLGHLTGDRLLLDITAILQRALRPVDLAARLGGDEFILLLDGIEDPQDVVRVVERLFAELAVPLAVADRKIVVSASIGVVFGPAGYRHTEEILRDADIAMYRAKHRGPGRYEVFDPAMHALVVARLQLENDLHRALERGEFLLHYQPIMELATDRVRGLEVLVRWQHPGRGLVLPVEFIPVAEETGLIVALGDWILAQAAAQMRCWQTSLPGARDLKLHVNLSVCQLREPDLLGRIDRILQESGLAGEQLGLEITEGLLMDDFAASETLLQGLKARRISISIDDFGTGYSSLAYLHRLPIDVLKIDQSFVRRLDGETTDSRESRIVETIVGLGRQLSLSTVAEGIETPAQQARLRAMGCPLGQGYLFSRPLPASQLADWLRDR